MTDRADAGASPLDHGRACLLVTGAPGAGKSTVTRLVAHALDRAALMDSFFLSTLVVSGRVWPLGEPADEADRQTALTNRNICALARNFADAGFTPVIDQVVPDLAQLEIFRAELGDRLRLVVLDPGADTCVGRNAARPAHDQDFFNGYAALRSSMQSGFGHLGWWLDTSRLTADETAALLLEQAHDRAQTQDRT